MESPQVARWPVLGWLCLFAVGAEVVQAADQSSSSGPGSVPTNLYLPFVINSQGIAPVGATQPGPAPVSGKPARAGQWDFSAGISGSLTATNNVSLAPSGQEEGDLVFGLSLPLKLRREGSRVKLSADYTPTVYLYAEHQEFNDILNNLRAQLSVEPIDNLLFVDATAYSFPTYISPFAPRPESGATATQNRTQQTILGLSPYLKHQTSSGWQYLLRNDNYWNAYNSPGLSDSFTTSIFANVQSPAARRLSYALDYTYLYNRDQSQSVGYYQQVGRIRPIFRATRALILSGRLGYESNDYFNRYAGAVYGAGIDWTPNARTKLDGFLEHRFFGPSYGLDLNYRTRRTAWTLNATRNTYSSINQAFTLRPGTTAEVLDVALSSKIPDPTQRQQAINQFLQQAGVPPTLTQPYTFFANQIYLVEQVKTGSVALLGRRNTISLTAFWQQNEPVTAGGTILPGISEGSNPFRQQGFRLNISHRLTAYSTVTLSADRIYAQSVNSAVASVIPADRSIQDTVSLGLTRQLSARTDASLALRWVNSDTNLNPAREVAILAALAHGF